VTGWNALFAPKGTPQEIITRVNSAGRAALADEGIKRRLLDLGLEISMVDAQTPQALGAWVAKEVDKWVPIIKKAGVTVQ
jgi:tripartite-type tricarboxylate transporter receptor subunit TctC